MMTDVMEQSGSPIRPGQPAVQGTEPAVATPPADAEPAEQQTGTQEPSASARIVQIRERIDAIDHELITLWQERAALSQEVGVTRMASGGTRLVLSREREILERFRVALGADGTQLALLLLRAGRGPL
ncbi:chorismate mutase [Micromonospora hortensis]|uniref:chorismate mutase n=1 Tax=Micromonospora hortensis TaxID=2911209 RepID=UPI001EE8A649|nr:chorismate mutase [Micromonospora hortensis]MCG5453656.1 chorismate mutase [Micromonospora hortensis]